MLLTLKNKLYTMYNSCQCVYLSQYECNSVDVSAAAAIVGVVFILKAERNIQHNPVDSSQGHRYISLAIPSYLDKILVR